jgi:hypothetical protein
MELVVKFLAKSTIWVRAYVYDSGGALVDPTSIKLTLVDALEAKKVDALAMTKSIVGVYDYYYNVAAAPAEGWWNGEVWTVDGAGDTAKSSVCEFSVEVRVGI